MKKLLLAGLIVSGMSAVAQTPRLSLYEEFTGETCPPCAAVNPGLNVLLASPTNTPKVVAIKWQVPIPSTPTTTWSLYKTNQAEIDWRYKGTSAGGYGYPAQYSPTNAISSGINSAPTGLFDGQHAWTFGATSDHPFYVTNALISTVQSNTAAFSVTMARAWDPTYSSVNLTITITASAPFTAVGNLVFRTVMVEKEIHFATQPGTNGEKDFEDVAIASFPSIQNGTPMNSTWTVGQTQTITMNCVVPSYCRDKQQVAFVGFIQDDGNRKVAQAVRANPDPIPNDPKAINASISPFIICGATTIPTVDISNNGPNTITGFNIVPYLNGVAGTPIPWTGNLAVGSTTSIVLSSINVATGINTFSYNITNVVGTDFNITNNTTSTKFLGVTNYQGNPVAEGFSVTAFPPPGFAIYNNYNGAGWQRVTTAGGFGTSTTSAKLDFYATVPNLAANELILPPVSYTGTSAPTLSFDVAYSQYASGDNDQLDVEVSSDCGQTWTNVYSKAGTQLSTTGGPLTPAFTPNASQWRKEVIQLTGYAGMNVLVKFIGTSDYGNNLYLDNINLSQCTTQTISVTSSQSVLCQGQSAVLTASGANSYSWTTGQTTQTIMVNPTTSQIYSVYSNDATGCGDFSSFTQNVSQCTGISAANSNISAVSLVPNPTSGLTKVNVELVQNENVAITVMSSIGQVVYSHTQSMTAGGNSVSFNTESWANGVYFVSIATEKGSVNHKLTVSK